MPRIIKLLPQQQIRDAKKGTTIRRQQTGILVILLRSQIRIKQEIATMCSISQIVDDKDAFYMRAQRLFPCMIQSIVIHNEQITSFASHDGNRISSILKLFDAEPGSISRAHIMHWCRKHSIGKALPRNNRFHAAFMCAHEEAYIMPHLPQALRKRQTAHQVSAANDRGRINANDNMQHIISACSDGISIPQVPSPLLYQCPVPASHSR